MSVKEENICRLCLSISENDCEVIDETVKEMLEVLSIKMSLDVSEDPIMCEICSEIVKRSYTFKSMCVDTKETVAKEIKFKLETINEYMEEAQITKNCFLCTNPVEGDNSVALDVITNDSKFVEVLPLFMPEMDVNDIENLTVCKVCRENLNGYCNLTLNCLNTEEKINTYCQRKGTNSMGQVELIRVLHYFTEDNPEYKLTEMCVTKQEIYKPEDIDIVDQSTKTEALDVENEPSVNDNPPKITDKDILRYNCTLCTFITKYKANLRNHMLSHKAATEGKLYKCTLCDWKSTRATSLVSHKKIHKTVRKLQTYNCTICTYETTSKSNLNHHLITHKDSSELEMHKCPKCPYETKYRFYLKHHMIVHLNSSQTQVYRCDLCAFETRSKPNLKRHVMTHRDISEVHVFKCLTCSYKSRYKKNLTRHILSHREASEVEVYRCTSCMYETKHKDGLKLHLLSHKDAAETKLHNCTLCDFTTKYRRSLLRHTSTHKDAPEPVRVKYKCTMCAFETKYKRNLTSHEVIHQDSSEAKVYKCSSCTYETRHKRAIVRHVRIHKTPKK